MPSRFLEIHPKDPQPRLIRQAVEMIRAGGIVVYPTDSCYALGCHIGDKAAMERIARIRQTDKHHHFTLVCRDLSEIAHVRARQQSAVPHAEGVHARAVHVHPAGDPRDAQAAAESATPHDRHPRARPSGAARDPHRARRAAHELDAAAARRRAADDRCARDPGAAAITSSTRSSTAATAAWSRPA